MRVALPIVLSLFCLVAGTPHRAMADYDHHDDDWNGLAYLVTTAEEAAVTLTPTREVDLGELRPRDVVWLMYPTGDLPVRDLVTFVREGGRLIIADDQGTSAPLLKELGVHLEPGPPSQQGAFAESSPALPILSVDEAHFIFFNVEEVVANHPAVLTAGGTPLLSFPGGAEHLITEVRQGSGQALVISDPSLFINAMLRRFYGNKQFAANVLRVYCPRDQCEVLLALPETVYRGEYRAGLGLMGDAPSVFRDAGLKIDEGLARFSTVLAGRVGTSVIMVLLLWGVLAILWLQLRSRLDSPRPPLLATPHAVASPLELESYGLSGAREDADFQTQARALLAEAQALVERSTVRGLQESAPWLRIQAALLSLERSEPFLVTSEQFLALTADVEELRRECSIKG